MNVYAGTRDVVIVTGPDAAEYLQGQISQDVDAIADGASAWSFILQPMGKVEAWFRISRDGDRFVLDVDTGWGEVLESRLRRFLLRVDVQLERVIWQWHAFRPTSESGGASSVEPSGDHLELAPAPGEGGVDVIGPSLAPVAATIDDDEFEELRIEAGTPRMGAELGEDTIPAAAGVVDASASFTKGCYTGQELVARVDSRGNNTPTQLRRLRGTGEKPDSGMTFMVDDDAAGTFTSVAGSDGNWVALGYVKRSAADADEAMTGGGPARIERVGDFA